MPASATAETEDSNATPKASIELFMMKSPRCRALHSGAETRLTWCECSSSINPTLQRSFRNLLVQEPDQNIVSLFVDK